MDFPAYVPAAVRTHIESILYGEQTRHIQGFVRSLEKAQHELVAISESLEREALRGEDEYLDNLRVQKVEATTHRDELAFEVDCLLRLAHDPRMREAFAVLTREISEEEQWRGFIYSAWAARVDFAKYRDRLKRATVLKGEIAEAAENLSKLIRQFEDTGVNGPSEFYSVPELLRQTDNIEMNGHNLHMWRSMRLHVLGDLPRRDIPDAKQEEGIEESKPSIEIVFVPTGVKADIDPEEKARNMLSYAWGTAPDFSALLKTMADAARAFKPSESGMIGAAIESRQKSPKTEYVRAFGNLLAEVHKFELTAPVQKAIAVVANVVINQPDVDVTYDDVRKALVRTSGERMEDSGKK